jgi:hypothetical protein
MSCRVQGGLLLTPTAGQTLLVHEDIASPPLLLLALLLMLLAAPDLHVVQPTCAAASGRLLHHPATNLRWDPASARAG